MPVNTNTDSSTNSNGSKSYFVNVLALLIILLSASILLILIFILKPHIGKGDSDTSFAHTKELLTILLPVIGTWMGTILAFYFSKENFEAANKSVKDLVAKISSTDEKLQVVKANDVMLTPQDGTPLLVENKAEFEKMLLSDLQSFMIKTNTERMPVLERESKKYIFLIYRTTVDRFIVMFDKGEITLANGRKGGPITTAANANVTQNPKGETLTVADMLTSDFSLIKSIQAVDLNKIFIPVTSTLDRVKKAMQDNDLCKDIFLTTSGSPAEPVLGWITNDIVIEKAEVFQKTR